MIIRVKETQPYIIAMHAIANSVRWTKGLPVELEYVKLITTEIVLVKCDAKEAKFGLTQPEFGSKLLHRSEWKVEAAKWYKPILISLTEKICKDDFYYSRLHSGIFKCIHDNQFFGDYEFKIVGLPEHFSPKDLQSIVDGKIVDRDTLLVECEAFFNQRSNGDGEKIGFPYHDGYLVKLDSDNYVTIHSKMNPLNQENYPVVKPGESYIQADMDKYALAFAKFLGFHPPYVSDKLKEFKSNLEDKL